MELSTRYSKSNMQKIYNNKQYKRNEKKKAKTLHFNLFSNLVLWN